MCLSSACLCAKVLPHMPVLLLSVSVVVGVVVVVEVGISSVSVVSKFEDEEGVVVGGVEGVVESEMRNVHTNDFSLLCALRTCVRKLLSYNVLDSRHRISRKHVQKYMTFGILVLCNRIAFDFLGNGYPYVFLNLIVVNTNWQ